jgi:hypothetical protein
LIRRLERKGQLGRTRHRWEDDIRVDIININYEGVNWLVLAQDRDQWRALVKTLMKLCVS